MLGINHTESSSGTPRASMSTSSSVDTSLHEAPDSENTIAAKKKALHGNEADNEQDGSNKMTETHQPSLEPTELEQGLESGLESTQETIQEPIQEPEETQQQTTVQENVQETAQEDAPSQESLSAIEPSKTDADGKDTPATTTSQEEHPQSSLNNTEVPPEPSQPQKKATFDTSNGTASSTPRLKRPPLRHVDLTRKPEKSILKKETAYPFIEQPARNPIFKSQWLQSTVSKLAVISGPQAPTNYTANSPSMFRKLVTQATAAAQGTPNYAAVPTSTATSSYSSSSGRSFSHLDGSDSASLLSDKSLKRVQFSVGQLATEHVFYHDDAYESAEESDTPSKKVQVTIVPTLAKKPLTTTEGVVVDDNIYTAKEIMQYYLVACNHREEFPVDRLVSEMREASSRPSNPLLTTIDLTDEPLPRKTLDPISDVLTLEFGLSHLILDNCGLEDDTLKMLLYSLLLTDTLTSLSVQDNKKIKSTGFKYIAVFVKKTKSLKSLNVSGIPMDKKSIEFLAHALKIGRLGYGSRLEELRMDRCGMRGALLETMAPAIRESNLRHLSLRSNRIGTAGGVWIGVLMRDYEDLPNKAIPNNNEEQGFRRVFPGIVNPELLKRTRGVESLDVSDNDLRQGADYIAQTLRRNMSLKRLVLANNNLDHARLVAIAEALKLNIGLESLDLSYNRVCGPLITGVNALTSKLAYNKTLKKLCLSNTGLQSEGAIALAEFLPETRTLAELDLTGNDLVDIAGVMALAVSIRMNKSLTCLDMNVPPNDPEFARLSRDILRACIRNMEEKTGSNEGMPSPDDMPTNTIFRQPSPPIIPEQTAPSAEDSQWMLLEGVARELYHAKDACRRMEKLLEREKSLRRMWHQNSPEATTHEVIRDAVGNIVQPTPKAVPRTPGTSESEQLFHQCQRHHATLMALIQRVDNDKALRELHAVSNVLHYFTTFAYMELFEPPRLPPHVIVAKRTNSLPPADTTAAAPALGSQTMSNGPEGLADDAVAKSSTVLDEGEIERSTEDSLAASISGDGVTTDEPSFMLTDDEDLDDDEYTFDAMIDVRRTSLLDAVKNVDTSKTVDGDDVVSVEESEDNLTSASNQGDAPAIASPTKGRRERGPKLASLDVNNKSVMTAHPGGERSPSILASPLEVLRKAAEEEEGEVLRRGKELLENELETEMLDESLTGEELKQQILADV
ncbi:hypothetical protein BGZ94_002639 [Podila epigama]|nr:hypothetical protein BGZ94_002639 [Podila epigama]